MASKTTKEILEELTVTVTARLASKQSLIDKLDTSGWSSKDVKAFDNLIAEKRQLERNHHKMSFNDMTRFGQRKITSADLRAPDDWKYDAETATYKYNGKLKCAMDMPDSNYCHHDLCRYVRTDGISYLEYDTIIHYAQRIANAKTPRMKDALRKQRDGQLLKDIQANEEWKERAIKKFRSFGKDAAEALLAAASQFDKAWHPPAPPENPDNAIEQVGRVLSSLRMAQLSEYEKDFCQTAYESLNARHTFHWRDPSCYLEFFQNVELRHLDATVSNVREVFELNGILTYEADHRLCAFLEQLRDLIQQLPRCTRNTSGFTVGEVLSNSKRFIEMENRTPKDDSGGNSLKPGHIINTLSQCLAVEVKAREKMRDICANLSTDAEEQLLSVRREAAENSPIPHVSMVSLDLDLRLGRLHCLVRRLLGKEGDISKSRHRIIDYVSQQLKSFIVDEPSELIEIYEELTKVLDQYFEVANGSSKKKIFQDLLHEAYTLAEPMIEERENLEQRAKARIDEDTEATLAIAISIPVQPLPGMDTAVDERVVTEYIRAFWEKGYQGWGSVIARHLWRGVSELFLAYVAIHVKTSRTNVEVRIIECDLTNLVHDLEFHARLFIGKDYGILNYFTDCRDRGWCLPSTTLHFVILLAYLCTLNPYIAKSVLRQLSWMIEGNMATIPQDWVSPLILIGRTIQFTYGYLTLEAMRVFGRSDVERFVITLLWVLIYHSIFAISLDEAKEKFEIAFGFMLTFLPPENVNSRLWTLKVRALFTVMMKIYQIRCDSPGLCVKVASSATCNDGAYTNQTANRLLSGEDMNPRSTVTTAKPEISDLTTTIITERGLKRRKEFLNNDSFHRSTLLELVELPQFDALAAARVLKYIAFQLRHGVGSNFSTRNGLNLLWYAFSRAEIQMRRTPVSRFVQSLIETQLKPTSLNIGMHNHCNIWELSACDEKCHGFWQGHKLGYRDIRDTNTLLESVKIYAIQHGSTDNLETKLKRMRKCSSFPEILKPLFDGARAISKEELQDEKLRAQLTVNRLDFLTHMTMEDSDQPDISLFDELTEWPEGAKDYFTCLETMVRDLGEDPQALQTATSAVLADLQNGLQIQADDERISAILSIAEDVWLRTDHVDVIYSDEEYDSDKEHIEDKTQYEDDDTDEPDTLAEMDEDRSPPISVEKLRDASQSRCTDEMPQNFAASMPKLVEQSQSNAEQKFDKLATSILQTANGMNSLDLSNNGSSRELQKSCSRNSRPILKPVSVKDRSRASSTQPSSPVQRSSVSSPLHVRPRTTYEGECNHLLPDNATVQSLDTFKHLVPISIGSDEGQIDPPSLESASKKKENKIMIQAPDPRPRGRNPTRQSVSRNVKSRSPTPYPNLNNYSTIRSQNADIRTRVHDRSSKQPNDDSTASMSPTQEASPNCFPLDGVDVDNCTETSVLSYNSQIPERIDALQDSLSDLLRLTLKGTPINDLMCRGTEGMGDLEDLWTSVAAVKTICTDLKSLTRINGKGERHEREGGGEDEKGCGSDSEGSNKYGSDTSGEGEIRGET